MSSTIQSLPGASLAANLVVPSATVAQTLGRPLAGGASSVTINLIAPQTLFGDRINQVDFRVAKVLRFGRTRTQVGVDIFNVMNSNVPQGYLQTFGADLAEADLGDGRPLRADQRADRFLRLRHRPSGEPRGFGSASLDVPFAPPPAGL